MGTPYNCLSCESHDGSGCQLQSGYCIIIQGGQRTCFAKNQYKPGNPCQVSLTSSDHIIWDVCVTPSSVDKQSYISHAPLTSNIIADIDKPRKERIAQWGKSFYGLFNEVL